MTDLDAIRARDAALIEENGYLFPPGEDYDSEPWRDRRALLAEVDRLTAQHASCCEQNVAAERARIVEAVRELPIAGLHPSEVKGAVLALLEP